MFKTGDIVRYHGSKKNHWLHLTKGCNYTVICATDNYILIKDDDGNNTTCGKECYFSLVLTKQKQKDRNSILKNYLYKKVLVKSVSMNAPKDLIGKTVVITDLYPEYVSIKDKNNISWCLNYEDIEIIKESNKDKTSDKIEQANQIDDETKIRKNDSSMKKMKFIPKNDIEFVMINGVEGILVPDTKDIVPDTDEPITSQVFDSGMTVYYNKNGEIHNINDKPAIIAINGDSWCKNGRPHRTKGPAFINERFHQYHWYYEGTKLDSEVNDAFELGILNPVWRNWTEEDEQKFIDFAKNVIN